MCTITKSDCNKMTQDKFKAARLPFVYMCLPCTMNLSIVTLNSKKEHDRCHVVNCGVFACNQRDVCQCLESVSFGFFLHLPVIITVTRSERLQQATRYSGVSCAQCINYIYNFVYYIYTTLFHTHNVIYLSSTLSRWKISAATWRFKLTV